MSDAWGGPPSGGGWQQGGGPHPGGRSTARSRGGGAPGQIRGPLFEPGDTSRQLPEFPEFDDYGSFAEPSAPGRPPHAAPAGRGVPEQREAAEPLVGGRAQRRHGVAEGVPQERRRPGAVPASVLIGLPLVAALVSGGGGVVFDAGAVLGALGAALLCSRPGVWWVSTATPAVVLLMALAGLAVRDSSTSTGKFATNLATCVAGAFPAMGVAMTVAVVVGVVRFAAARRGR